VLLSMKLGWTGWTMVASAWPDPRFMFPPADRQRARLLRRETSMSEKATGDHSRRSRRPGNPQLLATRPLPHLGGAVEQLKIHFERYEEALCKQSLRRESTKNKPLTSKPTKVRAKALGSGVATVLAVTSNRTLSKSIWRPSPVSSMPRNPPGTVAPVAQVRVMSANVPAVIEPFELDPEVQKTLEPSRRFSE